MEDVGIITDALINEVLTNSKKFTVIVNPFGSVKSKLWALHSGVLSLPVLCTILALYYIALTVLKLMM